jgi:hypothetical protein
MNLKIQRAGRGIVVASGLLTAMSRFIYTDMQHLILMLSLDIVNSYVTASRDGPSSWHSNEDFVERPLERQVLFD